GRVSRPWRNSQERKRLVDTGVGAGDSVRAEAALPSVSRRKAKERSWRTLRLGENLEFLCCLRSGSGWRKLSCCLDYPPRSMRKASPKPALVYVFWVKAYTSRALATSTGRLIASTGAPGLGGLGAIGATTCRTDKVFSTAGT